MKNNSDPIGRACLDFFNGKKNIDIIVKSDTVEDDVLPVDYLFRSYEQMPLLEKIALKHVQGRILDVGAAVGSHALYLQKQNHNVFANEYSPLACQVMKQRGVKNIICQDFYSLDTSVKYDTVLMLMNGFGIAKRIDNLTVFFNKIKDLLAPQGALIVDSSDLRYLYEDEDGSMTIDLNNHYYGEVKFLMQYKEYTGQWFDWIYIDLELLEFYANQHGLKTELIKKGNHYDYLVKITR